MANCLATGCTQRGRRFTTRTEDVRRSQARARCLEGLLGQAGHLGYLSSAIATGTTSSAPTITPRCLRRSRRALRSKARFWWERPITSSDPARSADHRIDGMPGLAPGMFVFGGPFERSPCRHADCKTPLRDDLNGCSISQPGYPHRVRTMPVPQGVVDEGRGLQAAGPAGCGNSLRARGMGSPREQSVA